MGDRRAVFSRGKIEQVGSPAEVYERPATAFVAGFIGVSNVLEGEVAARVTGSGPAFTSPPAPSVAVCVGLSTVLEGGVPARTPGSSHGFTIRPKKIEIVPRDAAVAE